PRRAGTLVVSRFETVDAGGNPVSTTDYASVYRGVALAVAEERPAGRDAGGAREDGRVRWQEAVEVGATAGHIYTECARIWNPIHTDVALARAAGLPGPILHGTATLALAVSRVVAREIGGDPERVRGVAVRFTGMVPMPSVVTSRGYESDQGTFPFDVVDAAGRPVLGRGVVKT